jgi:hypothetical protein
MIAGGGSGADEGEYAALHVGLDGGAEEDLGKEGEGLTRPDEEKARRPAFRLGPRILSHACPFMDAEFRRT